MSKYVVISGPYVPVFGPNVEIFGVNLLIQSEYKKIRTTNNHEFEHFSRSDTPGHLLGYLNGALASLRTLQMILRTRQKYLKGRNFGGKIFRKSADLQNLADFVRIYFNR